MQSSYDALGDKGRKALNACVKVKIYGKPETRKYDRRTSLKRLRGCYADWNRWVHLREHFLLSDKHGKFKSSCDIVDIHDELIKFDETKCVAKYPKEGPESVKQREVIDKRRADVERELEEAIAHPDSRLRYSWVVAQRRVRDCFAGNFAEDDLTFSGAPKDSYNIVDIHEVYVYWDEISKTCEAKRASLEQEYTKALNPGENVTALSKYSRDEALRCLKDCYYGINHCLHDVSPIKLQSSQDEPDKTQSYDIFDIHEVLLKFDGKNFQKYPKEGPGADELRKLIDEHRVDLEEEYQKATTHEVSNQRLPEYTRSEAEHRVRDCFAGTLPNDTEIFPKKEVDKCGQTYDIIDIKNAIDYFDTKTFLDAFKYASNREPGSGETNQGVNKQRADIQDEYEKATSNTEIEHGSGFIIYNHFVITNKHVIETYLNNKACHEIHISNAAIDDISCEDAHCDPGKDLALLYCPDLNLEQYKICPLQLSSQSVLPGMSIFAFGYPMSHTGKTALFVSGSVSGSKDTPQGHSMIVMNCSLNSGNSGGPVLCWVNDKLKVIGIATQKHFKEILTLEEMQTIEEIRKSLQTHAIPDLADVFKQHNGSAWYYSQPNNRETPLALLTLKLYDALETHSQFNLSNALPGYLVVEFIKTSISKYEGEHKEELAEAVELAKDHVNILPSGHLSACQCFIQ